MDINFRLGLISYLFRPGVREYTLSRFVHILHACYVFLHLCAFVLNISDVTVQVHSELHCSSCPELLLFYASSFQASSICPARHCRWPGTHITQGGLRLSRMWHDYSWRTARITQLIMRHALRSRVTVRLAGEYVVSVCDSEDKTQIFLPNMQHKSKHILQQVWYIRDSCNVHLNSLDHICRRGLEDKHQNINTKLAASWCLIEVIKTFLCK
jgi:hypothetical protein